jgi:Protein of unknown function (DUF4240)
MQVLYLILTVLILVILLRLIFRKVLDLPAYSGKLFTHDSAVENLLSEEKFWIIIKDSSSRGNRNYQYQCQLLTERLENMSSEEIVQFDKTFTLLMARSFSYKLWEPAYALNGGCSDDGFEYFRSWLIAQGKNKFYWTIKYPRLLFLIGVKEMIENYEGIGYCAFNAYQSKTGGNLPEYQDIQYSSGGKIFKEGEAFFRYPELALLAW